MEIFLLLITIGISTANVIKENLDIYEPDDPSQFIRKSDYQLESTKHFQGDIIFKPKIVQKDALSGEDRGFDLQDDTGTGMRHSFFRWPKKNGQVIVPYVIDERSGYGRKHLKNIMTAMKTLEHTTECIRFVKKTVERDFISIQMKKEGCFSYIGKIGRKQIVNLDLTCAEESGVVIHELIHALGFYHMQSHPERDNYVKINFDNMDIKNVGNFVTLQQSLVSGYRTPYDYYSIMHYGPYYFSKNGRPTILPVEEDKFSIIGQRNDMSPGDVIRLVRMYECPEYWRGESAEESAEKRLNAENTSFDDYAYEDASTNNDADDDDDVDDNAAENDDSDEDELTEEEQEDE